MKIHQEAFEPAAIDCDAIAPTHIQSIPEYLKRVR